MGKGQLILATEGIFSDYEVICLLEALKDFNPSEQMEAFATEIGITCEKIVRGKKIEVYRPVKEFVDWLVSKGLVKRVPFKEMDVETLKIKEYE